MRYLSDHIKLAERKKLSLSVIHREKMIQFLTCSSTLAGCTKSPKHTHTHTAHTDVVNVKHFTQQGLVAHFITVVKDATHQGINRRQ